MSEILRDLLGGNIGYARELIEATVNRPDEEKDTEDKKSNSQSRLDCRDLMRRIRKRV